MIAQVADAVVLTTRAISQRADACVRQNRVIAAREECHACSDVCAAHGIDLDPLRVNDDRCDGCMLCVPACPTPALDLGHGALGDLNADLNKVRAGARFVIGCRLATPSTEDQQMQPRCLAGVSWEQIAIPLLLGASAVELRRGDCGSCAVDLDPLLAGRCDGVEKIARALGLGTIEHTTHFAPGGARGSSTAKAAILSRREVFSRMFRRGRSVAAQAGGALVDAWTNDVEASPTDAGAVPTSRLRETVGRLIANRLGPSPVDDAVVDCHGLAGSLIVKDEACTRCGVCAAACPTDAITQPDTAGSSLFFSSERCACCDACARGCPESCLRVEGRTDLGLWGREPIAWVEALDTACRGCGGVALSPMIGFCARCLRSQRAEGHPIPKHAAPARCHS